MSKLVASNTFTEGLMKDTNPLTTPNNILTDCLNGTTITYNGKEFVLQNDMGNAIVETASLKRGYIPIGLKEYNGIIYVVSYNPLEDRVEFGSFPSPERDFSGEDMDTADFLREGCVLSMPSFYGPNMNHPDNLGLGTGVIIPEGDAPVIIPESNLDLSFPNVLTPLESTYVDVNPIGVGVEDYWEQNMGGTQSKFNIIKNNISDDFSLYPELRLNAGDRFVIYYIDNLNVGPNYEDYVTDILKPFISNSEIKKLFKIEVFAVTTSGRKRLTADPLLYSKSDIYPSGPSSTPPPFLNGSLDENVNYSIYDFDGEGTIEIRISLEKPDYFNVRFKQYLAADLIVKFTTLLSSPSYMQIKGFKYILTYLTVPSAAIQGYMYYTKQMLYTNVSLTKYQKNDILSSSCLLGNLQVGTYSYKILPFTQYGYEYDLLKKGTFEVSEDYTNSEENLVLDTYKWFYDSVNNNIQLDITGSIILTPDQTLDELHMEIYDVWSNASHIINLTLGFTLGDLMYANTFTLNSTPRTDNHERTDTGTIYGVPYSELQYTNIPKLTNNDNNFESRNTFIDNSSLRNNHFYVVAIYYTYTDTLLNQTYQKGIFRYLYTNDAFNSNYTILLDFSSLSYPMQTIDLNLSNIGSQPYSTSTHSNKLSSYLFDPLLQSCNTSVSSSIQPNPRNLTPYMIGPENYVVTTLAAKPYAIIEGIFSNQIQIYQSFDYVLPLNTPGELNKDILVISDDDSFVVTPDTSNRTISSSGIVGSPTEVLGVLENATITSTVGKLNNQLIVYYQSNLFKIYTNKLFPYVSESILPGSMHYLYPLFYQLTKEVQDKITDNNISIPAITQRNLRMNHYILPPSNSVDQFIEVSPANTPYKLNMNDYNDTPYINPAYTYGILNESGLMFNRGVIGGIYYKTLFNGPSTLKNTFLDATKRLDRVTYPKALVMDDNRNKQFVLINSQGTAPMSQAIEVDYSYNTANIFLFFGAYIPLNTPGMNYYKVYTADTDYYYEDASSYTSYNITNDVQLLVVHDYCYTIMMGAKNKNIILREDSSDENLRDYILGKFVGFLNGYSNEDFFPKTIPNHPTKLLSINSNENISLGSGPQTWINTTITNALSNANNHPLYFPSDFQIIDGVFIKHDFRQTYVGNQLVYLTNNDGIVIVNNELSLKLLTATNISPSEYKSYYGNDVYNILHTFNISQ